MSVDNVVKLIDAIAGLLGVLVWPGVVALVLLVLGKDFRRFLSSVGELTLKGAGFEASLKRTQAEAAAALAAALASKNKGETTKEAEEEIKTATSVVAENVTLQALKQANKASVLWVDDRPGNNVFERRALEALGISLVLATSTEEALTRLKRSNFNVIISDMGRPPDARAGYTLLDKIRSDGDDTPFIIYANSRDPEHIAESRRHGAIGCTGNANELFEMVLSAL